MSDNNGLILFDPNGKPILVDSFSEDLNEVMGDFEVTVFMLDLSASMAGCISDDTGADRSPRETSKLEILKRAIQKYVETRYKQTPDARVAMVGFSSVSQIIIPLTDSADEVVRRAKSLRAGGSTRMDLGLQDSLSIIAKVGDRWMPRLVIVSDGQPDSQERVIDVIQANKDVKLSIDTLYIGSAQGWRGGASPYAQFMKELSERTGGTFTIISSEEEFERKFLAATTRPMLTAGKLGG